MELRRITFPLAKGKYSRQAHADLPKGTFEREISREGFYGNSTHIYHKHKPCSWLEWNGSLQPHAFDLNQLCDKNNSPLETAPLIFNADGRIKYWKCDESLDYLVANADGDEILFIHKGAGQLYCDFGHINYRDGDFLLIPRGTMWRIVPDELTEILMIEATNDAFYLPEKGMLGYHAIFDRAIFEVPEINNRYLSQQDENEWMLYVKRQQKVSSILYPFNPLDGIGWHGEVSVLKVNWRDIRPIMSHRYNLPPSVHCIFITNKFDVGTFVPRPIESDLGALKVPFFHSNADEDEFMFFHKGQFFSRDNIEPGMVTLHKSGFVHGPHPKAFRDGERASRKETDEVALKIDFRQPVEVGSLGYGIEIEDYKYSWKE